MCRFISICIILIFCCTSCDTNVKQKKFAKRDSKQTGITFNNELDETPVINIFNYLYFYNGGGVATGDVNGDELPDIFFTSNQKANKLYLNKGNFQFVDISQESGISSDDGWSTGVTMADINADGLLDIYVCQVGKHLSIKGKNKLYINQGNKPNGIPIFKNQAEEYGLDISAYSTQAGFFDYDLDGDLDMFLLNHSVHNNGTFGKKKLFVDTFHPTAGDRLFRNDGKRFSDQTKESGIHSNALGYGLGLAFSDFNEDGYPDIYVANDFHEDDYLYLNQGNGRFKDIHQESFNHSSRFSMGLDIGDMNNDGMGEVLTLDMLPEDPVILKSSAAEDLYDVYHYKLNYGYNHQFARNNFQYNLGTDPLTGLPKFSEIALFSNVAATDWSWSVLFADFDLDGLNDIFISNGIVRRSNDLDYINYISHDTIQKRLEQTEIKENDMALISKMPKIKLPNYLYKNQGDLGFTDVSEEWGLTIPSYSHGTSYADLDNDGDLDLVINNTEDEAGIYENLHIDNNDEEPNYLKVRLTGKGQNKYGIGAKVRIYTGDQTQVKELFPTRGFQSSMEPVLHFGIGKYKQIDSLDILWPGSDNTRIYNIQSNQLLRINQKDSHTLKGPIPEKTKKELWLKPISDSIQITYEHKENRFIEFNREVLIPHMMSEEGPPISIADFNGDGRDDIFVGNAKHQPANIFYQDNKGNYFTSIPTSETFDKDRIHEDVSSLTIDVDSDGDIDLLVGSGGNEFSGKSNAGLQRLYLNNGDGELKRAVNFPEIFQTNSDVLAIDFDLDNDLDLIFSARSFTSHYGKKPDSYLLENIGEGQFINVTNTKAPFLKSFGFVQDMELLDVNGDGISEILFAMEWDAIQLVSIHDGQLTLEDSKTTGLSELTGWWKTIIPGDFDQDGDMDFVGGNLGLNSKLTASKKHPLKMYYHDFDQNGNKEQILCYYYEGEYRVFHTKDEIVSQLPNLKKKFTTNTAFAKASLNEIFSEEVLQQASVFEVSELASSYFENDGSGNFSAQRLPKECQFSTIECGIFMDINDNPTKELILLGNFYPVNIQLGRYDGSFGNILSYANDRFKVIPLSESGLSVRGECRNISVLNNVIHGKTLVISRNDETLSFFRIHSKTPDQ